MIEQDSPLAVAMSDEEIIARVLAGDKASFEIVMRRYNQRLYRAARAILRDDLQAEDLVQEAWVRAYQHLTDFAGRASFSTWVLRITVNEGLARLRMGKRYAERMRREHAWIDLSHGFRIRSNRRPPQRSAFCWRN